MKSVYSWLNYTPPHTEREGQDFVFSCGAEAQLTP